MFLKSVLSNKLKSLYAHSFIWIRETIDNMFADLQTFLCLVTYHTKYGLITPIQRIILFLFQFHFMKGKYSGTFGNFVWIL